jgi:competence protein ComEA
VLLFGMPVAVYLHQSRSISTIDIKSSMSVPVGIQVHVSGALKSPGVYTVAPGTKCHELLAKLDLLDTANIQHLNLAKPLRDGQKITIKFPKYSMNHVNINIANHSQLVALPGIGPALAQKIITYRTTNGSIESMPALSNIIGKKKANAIQHRLSF